MGVEGDGRRAGHVAGHGGEDEAVFVLPGIAEADREEFVPEEFAEYELAGRTGISRGRVVGLGVDPHVTKKAFEERVHFCSP